MRLQHNKYKSNRKQNKTKMLAADARKFCPKQHCFVSFIGNYVVTSKCGPGTQLMNFWSKIIHSSITCSQVSCLLLQPCWSQAEQTKGWVCSADLCSSQTRLCSLLKNLLFSILRPYTSSN